MTTRAAVIGLDGAAWHLVDPLIEQGHMPNLARLRETGAAGVLDSTVPTYTPPAWTSAATGVNPGRHGIYGFLEGNAQNEGLVLVHSGKIRSPTIWEMANAQGARVGVYNLPLTYPPRELDGWMVSGMMTPGYGERLKGFAFPRSVEARILELEPDYIVDISPNWETDWKDAALCARILSSLAQRRKVLERLLEEDPVDVLFAVLEAPDRLQHVYYRYLDPNDPLYDTPQGDTLRPEIAKCFAAMDDIVGVVVDAAADGVIVCSDHGFTAWEFSVHTNALLQQWGYLKIKPAARAMQTKAARSLVPLAKRVLPAKAARQAKGKTFAAVDWSKTKAFASPIPQQGIFINLEGRERHGIVPQSELAALKNEIASRFENLVGSDGKPVTDKVWRAEEVFRGPALEGAPDLLPVLRNHRFELDDELFHKEPFTDLGEYPRGVHHPDGIVVIAGPGVAHTEIHASVMDVTPTLLYLAGLQVPDGLDGSVVTQAFEARHIEDRPVSTIAPLSSTSGSADSPYSEEEEAVIEESLRGLGYL